MFYWHYKHIIAAVSPIQKYFSILHVATLVLSGSIDDQKLGLSYVKMVAIILTFYIFSGGRRFSEGTSADREIQRTLMEVIFVKRV